MSEPIRASQYVSSVASAMNLTADQKLKLAQYSDKIVKIAYTRSQGRDLDNPFSYIFKICSVEAAKESQVNTQSDAIKPMAVKKIEKDSGDYHKDLTAMEIAQEISKIEKIDADKTLSGLSNGLNEAGYSTPNAFKRRVLFMWAIKDYLPTGDEDEKLALMFIDTYRIKFGLPQRIDAKLFEISNVTNEDSDVNIIDHDAKKDSLNLKFEYVDDMPFLGIPKTGKQEFINK